MAMAEAMDVAKAARGHGGPFEFDRSTIQAEDANPDPATGPLECQGGPFPPANPLEGALPAQPSAAAAQV
jgi:hypothetical protein